jgi:hypothetical protein
MRNRWGIALLAAVGCALAASVQSKDSFTSMALNAGFGPWRSAHRDLLYNWAVCQNEKKRGYRAR